MIAVKTCGKLYWAGEYAILEPGQLALIKAIPIYMRGEIAFSDSYRIYSDMFDFAVDLVVACMARAFFSVNSPTLAKSFSLR